MKRSLLLLIVLLSALHSFAQKGTGTFSNEIRIGTKTSLDTLKAGMIQHTAGDFQGYTGSAWRSFFELGVNYANVITIAKSGGDYTVIQAGIDACVASGPAAACLVRVMPGIYSEAVVSTKPFIHLQGAGKYNTMIQGTVMGANSCVIDGFTITDGIVCNGTSPKITNNLIGNPGGSGIRVNGVDSSASPWIKQNEIRKCATFGIECLGPPNTISRANPWIIVNKIDSNLMGGILCSENAWPTISNNQITSNSRVGIEMVGLVFPTEPTITDNVISGTQSVPGFPGTGIYLINRAEPRIISNDIYTNVVGININGISQPSVLANNINYNDSIGIRCASAGAGAPAFKRVNIQANHIHSNGFYGIEVVPVAPATPANPVIAQNVISYHVEGIVSRMCTPSINQNTIIHNSTLDVSYTGPPFPVVSMNIFDSTTGFGIGGLFNVTQAGAGIAP